MTPPKRNEIGTEITPSLSQKQESKSEQLFLTDRINSEQNKHFLENLNIFWGVDEKIDIDDIIGREKEHQRQSDFFDDMN